MTNVYTIFEQHLPERYLDLVGKGLPEDVIVAFRIDGVGGGEWQLVCDIAGAYIAPIDGQPKDCEISCSIEVFKAIVNGTVRSERAFLDGQIRIIGDIGLALRLEKLIRAAA